MRRYSSFEIRANRRHIGSSTIIIIIIMLDIEKLVKASTAVIGIVGAAPIYATFWMGARLVTLPLPSAAYQV